MQTTEEHIQSIKRKGTPLKWGDDLYHGLLATSWLKFFIYYFLFFLLFNLVFALLYYKYANSLNGTDNSLWHSFIFSVQTFSTVGYGVFSPQTNWAHSIVILESILSVFVTALLTGLTFAKFSRPSAKIIFSQNILINDFDGNKMLSFRMGNLRANQIVEAQVRMVALVSQKSKEGQTLRRQIDLKLERDLSLFFALTWTVMHKIDEDSPLYRHTLEDLIKENIEISISVIGYDSSLVQTVHANVIYSPEDIVFNRYFEDIVEVSHDGKVAAIDYSKFHNLKI